jgi:hypothetical protein
MARLKLDKPKGDGLAKGDNSDKSKGAVKARRWKRELQIASKRESEYRKNGVKIVKRYDGEEKKRNRYNILWANTDVLSPAVFNSAPEPDVRRRFRDSDPLGRAVGQVLERSLSVMCDGDMTVDAIKADVLDALLPGRGVSRIRYVPVLNENPKDEDPKKPKAAEDDDEEDQDPGAPAVNSSLPVEPGEGSYTEVEFEQVLIDHVDWRDFRHGYGRMWVEVPWCGFRHKISRKDWIRIFGKAELEGIKFAVPTDNEAENGGGRDPERNQETAKLAECWEIWDKDGVEVFFICEQVDRCLYPLDNPKGEPPLQLEGFFPCPKPLMFIDRTGSLTPIPLFHQYEEQANELDKISLRIDKIVAACKVRGIYDSTVKEFKDLLSSDDNDLTPIQNAQKYIAAGGLDKAVAWFPVEQAVKVLTALYDARDRQLKIIDTILGISDVVRGVTDPDETLGAQKMKGGYFSIRLWRYQQEVKRYGRDLLRLAAAGMAQMFSADTFEAMTDLHFPDAATKAAAQYQLSRPPAPSTMPPPPQGPTGPAGAPPGQPPPGATPPLQAGAVHPGAAPGAPPPLSQGPPPAPGQPMPAPHPAPPPPPVDPTLQTILKMPTWDDIIGMMRSPAMRQFRTDVETDSMIAGTLESDMSGLAEILEALIRFIEGMAPIVQSGALPVDAVKEIVMAVIRRARMGSAVEDAFDKMQAPKPQPAQQDSKPQVAQINAQADQAIAAGKAQLEQALEQMRQGGETSRQASREQAETSRTQMVENLKSQREALDSKFDAFVKIITATIAATKQPDPQVQPIADKTVGGSGPPAQSAPPPSAPEPAQPSAADQLHARMGDLIEHLRRPKKIVRDTNNRITGIE